MPQYTQRVRLEGQLEFTQNGLLGLMFEINRRLLRWEKSIGHLQSSTLKEKNAWVKNWMNGTGENRLVNLQLEASIRTRTLGIRLDRKADALLKVCDALESVEEETEDKYDSLLDWVLEIPSILEDFVHEEPALIVAKQSDKGYKQHLTSGATLMGPAVA